MSSVSSTKASWLGHIVTLAIAAITGAVGYGTLQGRVKALEDSMESMETQVVVEIRDLKEDLSELKVNLAGLTNDVRWLREKSAR